MTSPKGGGKLKKEDEKMLHGQVWSMAQGQVFLKEGADTFPIYFFQGLSFLHR